MSGTQLGRSITPASRASPGTPIPATGARRSGRHDIPCGNFNYINPGFALMWGRYTVAEFTLQQFVCRVGDLAQNFAHVFNFIDVRQMDLVYVDGKRQLVPVARLDVAHQSFA